MPREEVESWLAKAMADLEAARVLRASSRIPGDIVAFHLQQSVEKSIKGLLVHLGVIPPRSHDLRALFSLLPEAKTLSQSTAEALSPFAALARYPGFDDQPDDRLMDEFEEFAQTCVEELENSLQDESSDE